MSSPIEPPVPPDPPAPDEGADPFVDDLVDHAAAPFAGMIDPQALAEVKAELRMFLTAHPEAARVVDRGRPRTERKRSADEPVVGVLDAAEEDEASEGRR